MLAEVWRNRCLMQIPIGTHIVLGLHIVLGMIYRDRADDVI